MVNFFFLTEKAHFFHKIFGRAPNKGCFFLTYQNLIFGFILRVASFYMEFCIRKTRA